MKLVLGAIVLLRSQLSPNALDALLLLNPGTTQRTITHLASLVFCPDTEHGIVSIIHPSFPDFLADPSRCIHSEFLVRPQLHHTILTKRCMQILNASLRENPCDLQDRLLLNIVVDDLPARVSRYIPAHVQYAARYWPFHISEAWVDEDLLSLIESFFNTHLLHWIEMLSLLGALDVAIYSFPSICDALKVTTIRR